MNPPESNPTNSPSPFDPIAPAPLASTSGGGGAAGNLGGSPRPGQVSLQAISEAWKLLQPNMGAWIGGAVIYIAAVAIFQVLGAVTEGNSVSASVISLTITVVGSIVNVVIYGGLLKMAVETVKTGKSELSQMFNIGDVILNMCVAGFLTMLAYFVGLLFCILPGIYIAMCLAMTQLVIVDQKLGAFDAMRLSWNTSKPQWKELFTFFFVSGLLAAAGILACGVGLLVTLPLMIVASAVVYRDLFGTNPQNLAPVTYPNAPIADPNG